MPHFEPFTIETGPSADLVLQFRPNRTGNGVFFWRNNTLHGSDATLFPAIRPTISMSNVMPSKTSKLQRTRIKIEVPVPKVDVATGAKLNAVNYLVACDVELRVPEVADVTSRSILLDVLGALFKTAQSQQFLQSLVVDGEGIYA